MCMLRQVMIQIVLLTLCVYSVTIWAREVGSLTLTDARNEISISPRSRAKYTRATEVRERCPALTLRESHLDEPNEGQRPLMDRLSFRYGDWEQAEAGSPAMIPFLQLDDFALPAKIQLASFWVTDVATNTGQVRQLSGLLELMIIDGKSHHRPAFNNEAQFEMLRGFSALTIEVEGIYQQAVNGDAVCMLGCTVLPSPDGGVRFSNIQNSSGTRVLDRECNIMVQLNYPLSYNLTSRIIRGTIQSLVSPGDHYSFSPVSLSSQLSAAHVYEPTGRELVSTACTGGSESEVSGNAYKPSMGDFCEMTMAYLSDGSLLDIDPMWKCNGTTQNCRTIGPFSTYEDYSSFLVDYNTSRAHMLVQSFRYPCFNDEEVVEVLISFVLRLVPADEPYDLARDRSAVNGETLVAEGYWTNGSDTLCMVGCKIDDTSGQADFCKARISLHIPLSLSITQRDIFKGTISSLLPQDDPESFFPLTFRVKLEYNRNLPPHLGAELYYNYTMLDKAGAVLTQHEPESSRLKTSWLKYPSLVGEAEGHYQALAGDLSIHNGLKNSQEQKYTYMDFDLVAIDQYLPFVWSGFMPVTDAASMNPINDTIVSETDPKLTHRQREARTFLRCSGTMAFSGHNATDFYSLSIFTEGYYNPMNGRIYMVGCRNIKASWQQIDESSYDLNEGMDCEIEIVLEYPTTLAAWLLRPGVKVKVHSNRPVDDIFHFDDIDAETYPVLYRRQRKNIVSREIVEGALSILTLSLMLASVVSQLLYIGSHAESTPYVSLLMLGAQATGCAIPLVTGAESLLARKFDYRRDYFFQKTGSTQVITYVDKILTLVVLLFLLRIFEKVWRERSLLYDVQQSVKVPRERNVVVICFFIHAVGFVSVMALHSRNAVSKPVTDAWGKEVTPGRLFPGNYSEVWAGPVRQVSQEYAGLIEDLFLLPQAIGLSLWDVTGKPLRLSFFVGITLLQVVPHVYDYLRDPSFDFYGYPIYANPTFDFYTNVGNILIPALGLVLALLVYCQQRWKGFLRFPTGFHYQRLESKTRETELITTKGRNHLPPIPEDDE